MMMGGDKKKLAALIVARIRPSSDLEEMRAKNADSYGNRAGEPDEEKDGGEGLRAAAEEVMKAMEEKDIPAFTDALKSFFYLCDSEPHEEGPHPEEAE